jgi:hypothetical protein
VTPLRRLPAVLAALALVLSGAAAGLLAPAPVLAASPELTLVTDAVYDVRPDDATVGVTVDIVATSHKADTITRHYYFTGAYLAVLPGASGLSITSASGKPTVSVSQRTSSATVLRIGFPQQLGSGQSVHLRLAFSLVDAGGAPDRALRVSASLVALSLWAYASPSTPGSTVTLRVPAGYTVALGRGPIAGPTAEADGTQVWTTGALADPLAWILDVTADRPGAYVETRRSTAVGDATAVLVIRGWPDDPGWRERVGDLVVAALPVLAAQIGLPWPLQGDVTIEETLLRTTGGYAGLFDPSAQRLQVSYTASPGVVLHESAHAWFNGRLVADRWIAEAFASTYAEVAAADLGIAIGSPELTADLRTHAIPLNAWGPIGSEDDGTEAYAYAATLALGRAIAARAGADALRTVWAEAAAGEGAYRPQHGDADRADAPDWRGLLDLLEEATGTRFDDLWRTWVARPEDLAALDARVAARADYGATRDLAGDWDLPPAIRAAMRAWRFDDATPLLARARAVLQRRDAIVERAGALGIAPPAVLREDFEGDAGVDVAAREADAELAALDAIEAAMRSGAAAPPAGLLEWLGLVLTDPAGDLARATAAFSAGDADSAVAAALDAEHLVTTAADAGRARLISLGLLGLALVVFASILTARRGRARHEHASPG